MRSWINFGTIKWFGWKLNSSVSGISIMGYPNYIPPRPDGNVLEYAMITVWQLIIFWNNKFVLLLNPKALWINLLTHHCFYSRLERCVSSSYFEWVINANDCDQNATRNLSKPILPFSPSVIFQQLTNGIEGDIAEFELYQDGAIKRHFLSFRAILRFLFS